jgi:transcriptional regulator with XRE-family HTH domain
MRLGSEKVKSLCAERGISVGKLLKQAGVSRNAYYSLARRDSILPRTVQALAKALTVEESELLTSESREVEKTHALMKEVDRIVKRYPSIEPENVRHTLLLLREKPIERLRRALTRAQGSHLQCKSDRK